MAGGKVFDPLAAGVGNDIVDGSDDGVDEDANNDEDNAAVNEPEALWELAPGRG